MKAHVTGQNPELLKVFNKPIAEDPALSLLLMRYQICAVMLIAADYETEEERSRAAEDLEGEIDQLLDDASQDVREELLGPDGALEYDGTPAQLAEEMHERLHEIVSASIEHEILEVCEAYDEPRYKAEAHLAEQMAAIMGEDGSEPAGPGEAIPFPGAAVKKGRRS